MYYAGHGLMKNGMTEIVLINTNSDSPEVPIEEMSTDSYSLEATLREMAAGNKNTFTISLWQSLMLAVKILNRLSN